MKSLHLLICLASLVLCSCGIGSYSNPKGDPATLAQIVSTHEGISMLPKAEYVVNMIDGKPVHYGSWTLEGTKILLKPGRQKFNAKVFNTKQMSPFIGYGNVEFFAEAGKKYRFTGKIDVAQAHVWVENETTRKKVSKTSIIELDYIPPGYTPMILPVYVQ
jgi:hypothetical protein